MRSLFSSRPYLLAAALAVAGVLVLAAVVVMNSGGDSDGRPHARSQPTASLSNLDVAPTFTAPPEPTATAAPVAETNRQDCTAIRGTSYQSDAERDWYIANCPTVVASAPSAASAPASAGAPSSAGAPAAAGGSSSAASGSRPGSGDRLIIPSIGLDYYVQTMYVGVNAAGQAVMPTPKGYYDVIWYDFSAYSSYTGGYADGGNLVLAGHVTCAFCNNGQRGRVAFGGVPSLTPGASIQYITASGRTYNYVVTSAVDLYPSDGAGWDNVLSSSYADMTLITCNGILDQEILEYDQRRVVSARKVS